MLVKIEKLSKELSKERKSSGMKKKTSAVEDKETEVLLDDLRYQVRNLNQQNSSLKTKVQFFKTLHGICIMLNYLEAESRKRTPYTHIPPRVQSCAPPRKRILDNDIPLPSKLDNNEISFNFHEDINQLRANLQDSQKLIDEYKTKEEHQKKSLEEYQKSRDIDVLTLQHENNSLKKKLVEQRKLYDELSEKHKLISNDHKELLKSAQALADDLNNERNISLELNQKLNEEKIKNEGCGELQIIIDDLQSEKRILEQELKNMVDNKFSTSRDDEYQLQISTLKRKISELQNSHAQILQEKLEFHSSLSDLNEQLYHSENDKQILHQKMLQLQIELDQLRVRFKTYDEITLEDLKEAMALLKLKRDAGVTLEFLSNIGDIGEDKEKIKNLKQQYALCAEDLDKTAQLLKVQENINNGYKIQIDHLNQKLKLIQNEYEFRLEEFSRLAGN